MKLCNRRILRRKSKRGPQVTKADEANPYCLGAGSDSHAMGTGDWRLDRLVD